MINVGIIGSTGYAGSELVRLLLNHPFVNIKTITSNSYIGKEYSQVFENFRHKGNLICEAENIEELSINCDVIFLALPHGLASKIVTKKILENCKVIDLGADFRLSDINVYKQWYVDKHENQDLLEEAVYGLCEINRKQVKNARLIANPGCYTTCSILSLYPLIKENIIDKKSIIIDAKSGVTGAGRGASLGTHYCETNESIKAYKIASHRHTPEIEEQLSVAGNSNITLTFTPHLTPMNRGILATCYGNLTKDLTYDDISKIYAKYYGNEYFIRLTKQNQFPETKWVKSSNFCDIGFTIDSRTNRIIIIGAIDNLIKGAAGQAVQNMNIMFDFVENTGLDYVPIFPV